MIPRNQPTATIISSKPLSPLGIPLAVWVLACAHGLVDCYATFVQPLWPTLVSLMHSTDGQMQWTYIAWSLAGSITQLGFAQLADAGKARNLLWIGPIGGILIVGSMGQASGILGLTTILVVSNLGFAAFHPEAATLAGSEAPSDRARAMSIFAVGGFLGQAFGPSLSGSLVSHGGLKLLSNTIIPGLAVCFGLIIAWYFSKKQSNPLGNPLPNGHGFQPKRQTFRQVIRGKELRILQLVVMSVLRVAAAMGVPLALAYGLDEQGFSAELIGENQSMFLIGMGAGTLGCALVVNKRNEPAVIWIAPMAVAFLLPIANIIDTSLLWLIMSISGCLLGLTLPILTSRGQELLPEAPRVGSSLTMGVTWGLGAMLIAVAMACVDSMGNHFFAFYILACFLAISSLMSRPGRAPDLSNQKM